MTAFTDVHYYNPPHELPAGFYAALQPLAEWFLSQLVRAYDAGYNTGRLDAACTRLHRSGPLPPSSRTRRPLHKGAPSL